MHKKPQSYRFTPLQSNGSTIPEAESPLWPLANENNIAFTPLSDRHGVLQTGVQQHLVYYHKARHASGHASGQNEILTFWYQGHIYRFRVEDPKQAGRSSGAAHDHAADVGGNEVTAPMPGSVLKVLVEPGQTVEARQAVVIMVSMKMEMTLSAPQAGIVQAIHCQEGDLVSLGATLVSLKQQEA